MTITKEVKLTISKNKDGKAFLDTVFNMLPTNAIINKMLPGTGATTLEIKSHRHSIIVEPNVPVIEGKVEEHNEKDLKVIGVYEGVKMQDIADYLKSKVQYKKIITTPESYPKVKSAIERSSFNLYKDFFILLDECERVIQDSSYRNKIILPFEDFFKYKEKAMISATPIVPTDPRFAKFKHYTIEPDFTDYKIDLKLITTNSLKLSVAKYLAKQDDEQYFFFLNSTDVIASLIDSLGIHDESNIYCSAESVLTLKVNGFSNCNESLSAFNKYNFFTSRFFSAVDIKLGYEAHVIMLTETSHAFHSKLDPKTESIQILGRFRDGVKKAVHITNIDSVYTAMTESNATNYLKCCEHSYNDLLKLYKGATSDGAKATFKEALERVEYAQFLNSDGSKNYFVWDNFVNEERVKAYYTKRDSLVYAYSKCKHFKMTYKIDNFPDIEVVLNRLSKKISRHLVCHQLCDVLEDIYLSADKYSAEDIEFAFNRIQRSFPEIVEAYQTLGYNEMLKHKFNIFEIRKAMFKAKTQEEKGNFQFLDHLKLEFAVGSSYPSQIIIKVLRRIINELQLDLKPQIKLLQEYFDLSSRTTVQRDTDKKDIKGFTILKRNFD